MKRINTLTLLLLFLNTCVYGQTQGRSSINSGSGHAIQGGYHYAYTIGEAISGTSQNGALVLTKGIQQPEQLTSLPVELLQFTVSQQAGDAILHWQTSREIHSAYFMVDRSIDGLTFENIGEVAAAGFSDQPKHYDFTDPRIASLGASSVYYRLRQYDMDGHFTLSPVVRLALSDDAPSLSSLFPNPASTEAFLTYQNNESGQAQCTLMDIRGGLIFSRSLSESAGTHRIPVVELAEGIYFVCYRVGRYRQVHRLMITH